MKALRTFVRSLVNLARFPLALLRYRRTGATDPWAHQALIQLFCATGGRFNDFLSAAIRLRSRPLELANPVGVLGDLRGDAMRGRLGELRERGYATFRAALPPDMCERLMKFALETPAQVRRMDHEPLGQAPRMALFDPQRPLAVRYDYPPEALLDNADVQALLSDPSLLALAQAYLGTRPRADVLSMWWHTAFHAQPDSEAAQFYHFDLDRIKWLKIFIYLTDVGPQDGPHSFIEGSHRTGGIPPSMLRRGYVRLSDEEVLGHYGQARQVEFAAPRGTVIVEDTRGLHKGKAVSGHSRLILQLQFSNSLFGAIYPKAVLKRVSHPGLAQLMQHSKDVYAQYL
ncbi:phytanoyl-CoA dioxygenase family protein [Piscinibacter sp. XHJ-5]|uniref:phytanoyl-CoA dioxygenase family protein n=1 Tax=Piscinibacter sp. XHJ-5 TaxID=3037797 RepID=UPI002452B892|nr:phytanoyl-CoA dioxygenase family protein [Piscinibacter sp. XHJ-5]